MQKEIYIPVYLLFLSIVFITVSFLLYLTGGKNSKLLAKKLKFGALIISLTTVINCSHIQVDHERKPTCYMPPLTNYINISAEHSYKGDVIVEIDKDNVVECSVRNPGSEKFSFRIFDKNNNLVQKGDIKADDGKFDETKEDFKIEVKKDLPKGFYKIYFYPLELHEIKNSQGMHGCCFNLIIQ